MKLNTFLRASVITILFATLAVPLVTSTSLFFPFITGKNFLFRALVELAAGLWIILALRDRNYRPKFSWIIGAFLGFLFVMFVADLLSPNLMKSFWSNFERMEGFVTIAHLFVYVITAASILDTQKMWTRFFQTSIGVSLLTGFYGLYQLSGHAQINQGGVRLDSTFGNATYFSVYLLFHVFLSLMLLMRSRLKRAAQWTYGLIIAFDLFLIYKTETRGVVIGILAGLIVMTAITLIIETERKKLRRVAVGVTAAAVLLAGGFLLVRNSSFVQNSSALSRFASITNINEWKPRFYVWGMAWKGVEERPVFGWGQESFNYVFNKYYDPRMYTQEQWFDRTHDVVFDWLVAGGFLGLLGYLSIFAALFYYIWHGFHFRSVRHPLLRRLLEKLHLIGTAEEQFTFSDRIVLTGLLVAYFVQNLTVFDNITSYLMYGVIIAYVHAMKGKELSAKWQRRLTFEPAYRDAISAGVGIATVLVIYFVNAPGLLACVNLINALEQQPGGPAENLKMYQKALGYNSFGNAEIREQLIQTAISAYGSNADQSLKQQYFNLAQSEMQKQLAATPNDARYQLFMGTFLNRFGLFDQAMPYLLKAQELSPTKQTILFEVGSNYLNLRQPDKAVAAFKKAYDLDHDYSSARDFYAVALIYAGDLKSADAILTDAYGTVLVSNDQIIRAYSDTGHTDRVLAIWKKRAADEPKNSQNHISLAAAYLAVGDRTDAIAELQKAIELNPDFKNQGEYYISEIKAGRNP